MLRWRAGLALVLALFTSTLPVTSSASADGRTGGDQLWAARFTGQYGSDVAVSPDGAKVYVTGVGATIAYDARSGAKVWAAKFSGTGEAVGVHPDGSVVFVTGLGKASSGDFGDYDTIAYDAATGAELWRAVYDAGTRDYPCCLTVSPNGRRVFVTGESWEDVSGFDYATVAYDAKTGAAIWISRYEGPLGGGYDDPHAIGMSPDGTSVFVTGESPGASPSFRNDYATIAYDANTGTQRWLARYNSADSRGDTAYGLAVDPGGQRVYVTGCSGIIDYCVEGSIVTIAYAASSGDQLWLKRFGAVPGGINIGTTVAASPTGDAVYVAGSSQIGQAPSEIRYAFALISYDPATGAQRWMGFYKGHDTSTQSVYDMGVIHDGSEVFVTGYTSEAGQSDYATVAFEPVDGSIRWVSTYDGPGHIYDFAYALAVDPHGTAVYVTGESLGLRDYQIATVAYRA